jgi:DNA replication protein DnaC
MVMNNTTYNQLCINMEQLKLTQMILHLDEVTDFVTSNNLTFTEGLLKLSNYEVDFKEKNASKSIIKAAAFPFVKELKDYDFEFQPGVNEQEIKELCTLGFLEKSENIVFLGPSGVGKTHLATSIGIAAAKRRVSTYFISVMTCFNNKKSKTGKPIRSTIKALLSLQASYY